MVSRTSWYPCSHRRNVVDVEYTRVRTPLETYSKRKQTCGLTAVVIAPHLSKFDKTIKVRERYDVQHELVREGGDKRHLQIISSGVGCGCGSRGIRRVLNYPLMGGGQIPHGPV